MNYELKENTLFITFVDRLDSANADEVEKGLHLITDNQIYDELVFDFAKTAYVSSAGLRVLLKYGQSDKKLSIINVVPDVYNIFDMTGFTSILNIKKAFRKIDVTGCPIVGKGYTSIVYRLAKDTIVKVFLHGALADIEKEISTARKAFIYGIPTAISFDIVQVDDKYGVVFEMLECSSLCDLIIAHPENLDKYIINYAKLAKRINTTVALNSGLQSAKERYLNRLNFLRPHIDEHVYEKMTKMVGELKETNTLVHGDYHIKNIMVQSDDNYMLIDMYTVGVGNPIFELGGFYVSYIAYAETEPDNPMKFFGVSAQVCEEIFYKTLKIYFEGLTDEQIKRNIEKITLVGSIIILEQVYHYDPDQPVRIAKAKEHLNELIDKIDSIELEY